MPSCAGAAHHGARCHTLGVPLRLASGRDSHTTRIPDHPWIPTTWPDAVTVRGFIYDVDTGKLEEVSFRGPMGSFG